LRLNFFESLSDLIFEFGYHGVHRLHRFRMGGKGTHKVPRWSPLGKRGTWTGSPDGERMSHYPDK
jgi:hypothetical protein